MEGNHLGGTKGQHRRSAVSQIGTESRTDVVTHLINRLTICLNNNGQRSGFHVEFSCSLGYKMELFVPPVGGQGGLGAVWPPVTKSRPGPVARVPTIDKRTPR